MAGIAYNLDEVSALVDGPTPVRESTSESDLILVATEIREYLRIAMLRPRASPAKIAVGIAVLDIWNRLTNRAADDSKAKIAAAVASLVVATSPLESRRERSDDIASVTRRRLKDSIELESPWDQIWQRSAAIGGIIGFQIDVEAARADRLWESLFAFVASDARVDLGSVPHGALAALIAVEEKILATSSRALSSIKLGLASRQRPYLTADAITEVATPTQDWKSLDSSGPSDSARRVRVWFGTNREPTSRNDLRSAYSNRLSIGQLYYGTCQVNIPRLEGVRGGARPFISAWMRRGSIQGRERVENYYRFGGPDEFVKALGDEMPQAHSERVGLVFVHGYATSFASAAIGAARFSLNVKHLGPTAMFTWASMGRKSAYIHDESVVEQSRQQLIDFLETLSNRASLDHVDIVVHSLGNRLFLRSLMDWFDGSPPSRIPLRNLFLGAPDIDQQEFVLHSDVYSRAGKKTTLYSSNSDSALLASKAIHRGAPRVGLMPPVITAPDIDVIETSAVDFSRVRHAYVLESSTVRADIFNVQNGLLDPSTRANIEAAGSSLMPDYWRFA